VVWNPCGRQGMFLLKITIKMESILASSMPKLELLLTSGFCTMRPRPRMLVKRSVDAIPCRVGFCGAARKTTVVVQHALRG
jgi:hypothetical protein